MNIVFRAGLLLALAHAAFGASPRAPNIVIIFSDDHAYQAISAYGDPRHLIETPNIDRLAREGMRFDRCLVPNSICGPSRATLLTGTYNHINGFVNNVNTRFDGNQTTFPKLLHQAGYQTALVGKWHLDSVPTGFDFWQILIDQGVYYNPPMIRNGVTEPHHGYVTDLITDVSLNWLRQRDPNKPFLLMCQHKATHREWEPALRHLDHDQGRTYAEPPTLFDDYSGRSTAERTQQMTIRETMNAKDLKFTAPAQLDSEQRKLWDAYYEPRNAAFKSEHLEGDALVRWKYQRYLHDYLGCVRSVDESVGRVLDYLDEAGLRENTIVIYASDQGFFLGEHGWFDKRWIFEESMRTPFLVRWPSVVAPGSVSTKIVSTLDVASTLLDAANLPPVSQMQGRSLVPLLRGKPPEDWRKSFYYQYFEYPAFHAVRPHYGVVTDRYKLVHFFGTDVTDWELFDRSNDPHELKNVAEDPAYATARRDLEQELNRLRSDLKVPADDSIPASWFGGGPATPRNPGGR
ncbi:MAG: sulfatase [Opitutus sp.]